jgi:hypothetical protein
MTNTPIYDQLRREYAIAGVTRQFAKVSEAMSAVGSTLAAMTVNFPQPPVVTLASNSGKAVTIPLSRVR